MKGEMQEPIGVPQICLKTEFLCERTVEEKQFSRPIVMSGISREVREAKDSQKREGLKRDQRFCPPEQM